MPRGHKYSIGCAKDGEVVGVCTVGRPVARALDDGWTLELTRCCTDGTKNACSMLYAAAWRVAKGLGYKRLITYILDTEKGTSIKAAGWKEIGKRGGGSWNTPSRPRVDKHPTQMKIKYQITLALLMVAQFTLGQSTMEVAEGYIGKRVGTGICWELVKRTLKKSGTMITEQDITDDPQPGDICIIAPVTDSIIPIRDKDGHVYAYKAWVYSPHIAILSKKIDSETYELIEQNYNGNRDKVKKNIVSTSQAKFYRPRKGTYNKETRTLVRKSTFYLSF